MNNNKVGILMANRANWARSKTVIEHLALNTDIELHAFCCSSFLLQKFGMPVKDFEQEHSEVITHRVYNNVEGETLLTQTVSTGLLVSQLAPLIDTVKIKCLIVIADRYEVIAGAIAARYQNVPVIHIQGGEVSGNIDDLVRNSVSSLSELHFPCTQMAYERLQSSYFVRGFIDNYGCPAMDLVYRREKKDINRILNSNGFVGNLKKRDSTYYLVVFHPETENYDEVEQIAQKFFNKIERLSKDTHIVVLWPNIDAGSDSVAKEVRKMRERNAELNISFYKNFSAEDYICVLENAEILIGNSSSFIREASVIGKKSILVGDRQSNRDIGKNVVAKLSVEEFSEFDLSSVINKTVTPSDTYGSGDAGKKISDKICSFIGAGN
ncbi:UDP-N-acetylglucosamine 2-epimerase [Litoribacillus peritrichatus]|uniref:UDP-N-acetylglucosamine 2-epimerase n=1 Tax=Litoribacillus peritrichatus TaxID=718191 RepID=A0ABP7M1Y8_9GAMM